MGFKCGIVGLPNVGKSTLFNVLTRAGVATENFPFCTIDPHIGTVHVPDPRLDQLAQLVQPQKKIPAVIQFVDIAGLVKGASQGEGLGNQFLSHIREVQAIAQVVRCFDDRDVTHVHGEVDPLADVETIHLELMLADLQTLERAKEKLSSRIKAQDKQAQVQREAVCYAIDLLSEGTPLSNNLLTSDQQECLKPFQLLTQKPMFYVANLDEISFSNNPHFLRLQTYAQTTQSSVIAVCATLEEELMELSWEEQMSFLRDIGLEEPGLNRLIRLGYEVLNLQTFFTAGPQEVRAWTLRKGSCALQAAATIHTDFAKGFIRAEVIAYNDFIEYKGEAGAKSKGVWRLEGRDYVLWDGDVVHFRFNV